MTTTTPIPTVTATTATAPEPTAAVPPVAPVPLLPPSPAEPHAIEDPDTQPDIDASQRRKDPAADAAQRRRQLREVEATLAAERETAAATIADRDATIADRNAVIEAMRRDHIEELLGETRDLRGDGSDALLLHRPADLWDLGATPAQFDVDGKLDRRALADFIESATQGRDYLTRRPAPLPTVDPITAAMSAMRRGSGQVIGEKSTGEAWSAALKPGSADR